jgi:hypothetical protein
MLLRLPGLETVESTWAFINKACALPAGVPLETLRTIFDSFSYTLYTGLSMISNLQRRGQVSIDFGAKDTIRQLPVCATALLSPYLTLQTTCRGHLDSFLACGLD